MSTSTEPAQTQPELHAQEHLKEPPRYQVILLNDDFTPMDFVTHILQSIFNMDPVKANNIMLEIHHRGQAVCGVYSREIAEMKVAEVLVAAKQKEHPLQAFFEIAPGK